MLDEYRRSFGSAYDAVVNGIRDNLGLEPTGRPAKSTGAILAKLRRERIRLTQIQDIAGCRIIVDGIADRTR
jgi:putative GTP pyrophosphokinase